MTTSTAAIERTIAEYQKHQNAPGPFLALHTDATVVVNIAGRRVLGKPALAEAMTTALATPLAQVRTTVDIEDIRFVRPDVAIVSAVKNVHDEREDATGSALPGTGALTLLLVETQGRWEVASAQTTPRATA